MATVPTDNDYSRLANRHLAATLALAAGLHGLLIWQVQFDPDTDRPVSPPLPTLEITLVHETTEEAPEEADALAQANLKGGADDPQRESRPAAPLPAPFPAPEPRPAATAPPEPAAPEPPPEPPQERLMAEAERAPRVPEPSPPPRPEPKPAEPVRSPPPMEPTPPSAAQLVQRSMALASLNPEIGEPTPSASRRLRHKYINANTKEFFAASYMDAWRQKVERVGNMNYPQDAARNRLYGDLILDVALRPDGTVKAISLVRSSGHASLDEAAMNIVRLAAPFAAFPKAIREQTDILHITRTWQFQRGNRLAAD
jgi:protein TonB